MNVKRLFCFTASILIISTTYRASAEDPPELALWWGSLGTGNGQLDHPYALDTDVEGNIYVFDQENMRIQKFDSQGNYLNKWGSYGFADSLFLNPNDIAVDNEGTVYVLDSVQGSRLAVKKYGGGGAFLGSWEWLVNGVYPVLAVDANGFVYVASGDAGSYWVRKTTDAGTFVASWGLSANPRGIAADAFGAVYVSTDTSIIKFDSYGNLITSWASSPYSKMIDVDEDANVFVLHGAVANCIQKVTTLGTSRVSWGSLGPGENQFTDPVDIAADSHGNVYVADQGNHHIYKFRRFNYVGVFADSLGTIDCIQIPKGPSSLHVLAFTGTPTTDGITGAEFRIAVTNPTGYFFSYTPPTGAFANGNPMDLTPGNPNDPAGTTVLFANCRPTSMPHVPGDRINLGTISVYNVAGGPTDFIVMKKVPTGDAGMPYPRFFLCDSPFNTTVPMSMAEGSEIASRSAMNSVGCEQPPGAPTSLTATLQSTEPPSVRLEWQPPIQGHPVAYNVYREANFPNIQRINGQPVVGTSFVHTTLSGECYRVTALDSIGREGPVSNGACEAGFGLETLYLDTRESPNDGAAGPVSSGQILDSRYQYLITVQGTFSWWPHSYWTAGTTVLCGIPEQAPQNPSPNAESGWVGVDAEMNWSVPLAAGENCSDLASLGYPKHHGRLMIDLGSGPVHMEPIGGTPDEFAPQHRYVYLVRGQDDYARFSLVDSLASDNYGVLGIAIKFVNPSDASSVGPPSARLLALPNLPDPFNPTTEIRYLLATPGQVTVDVCDIRGRIKRRLISGNQPAGLQHVRWDGRGGDGEMLPSGIYFARIRTLHEVASERMTLIK